MDYLWVLVAFVCGFVVKQLGMPPLVGYLLAGFALNAIGVEPAASLNTLADLGITLMLFTIGLKLNIRALIRKEVWLTSLAHSTLWIVLLVALLALAGWLGLSHYFEIPLMTQALVAFALSFSSTVCVVKMLEEASELKARHGKIAVGILVIQDVLAVIFLVASTGKTPSVWAPALLALYFCKPLLQRLINSVGHGELLPLLGFFLALGGAELFTLVNMKGDLGALLLGMLLASSAKSAELYKSLMSFKDLFLIGFFLSIGFTALPSLDMALTAGLLLLILAAKFVLFFLLQARLTVSGRASYLSALALTNYSEFGLIVAHLSVGKGWMSQDWMVIIALVMAISFVISTFAYRQAHHIYALHGKLINRFERPGAHHWFERPVGAEILIVGMGRVGKGAYSALEREHGPCVWGVESDAERVAALKADGFKVVAGDADDLEFWQKVCTQNIRLVMLALPSQQEMRGTLQMLGFAGYQGKVAAVARYDDERQELLQLGVDVAFNYYSEVGAGFAAESRHLLAEKEPLPVAQQV